MGLVHIVDTLLEKIQHEILYDQVGTSCPWSAFAHNSGRVLLLRHLLFTD